MIEMVGAGAKAGFHITKAVSIGKLAKGHANKLAPASECFYFIIAAITSNAAPESFGVNEIEDLGKNKFSGVHQPDWQESCCGEIGEINFKSLTPSYPDLTIENKGLNQRLLLQRPDSSVLEYQLVAIAIIFNFGPSLRK